MYPLSVSGQFSHVIKCFFTLTFNFFHGLFSEPDVFEIVLPITVFVLSDDEDLFENEDEKQTGWGEESCLKSQSEDEFTEGGREIKCEEDEYLYIQNEEINDTKDGVRMFSTFAQETELDVNKAVPEKLAELRVDLEEEINSESNLFPQSNTVGLIRKEHWC